ncbi:TolC family protein [Bdellovibrio bacteriovorus]|uniref:TolC family protein n=1 Tax=Bdellovibrio bacteriovorus TaxID=959 RepID=UPI0021D07ACA|nr:TolC family protein [Bdellovibrio bacteriovorus]UXR63343.1 TolC family protein [Bdellovibrio bacteriovorus]
MSLRSWAFASLLISFSAVAQTSPGLSQLQKQLVENNNELRASQAKLEAQKAQAQSSWGALLPELSASAGYAKEKTLHDNDDGYVGYLNGSWNIFRGGQDWQNRKISQREYDIAGLDHEIISRRLHRELGETYYKALLNSQFISFDTEKLQFLKNQRAMAAKKINAGLTSNVDAIELDLEESTLSAEIETHKTDLQISLDELKILINSPDPVAVSAKDTFPRMSKADFSLTDLSRNPSIMKQNSMEETSQLRRRQALGEFLPTVDLNAQYGRIIPQYDDPLQGNESRLSVLMTWTFFSGFESWNKSKSASSLEKSEAFAKSNLAQQLQTQVHSLSNKASELLQLQQLLEKRQVLTQKYYDLTLSEYRRGVKNSSDLANATNSLFDNKTRLIEVQKELAVLKLKFDELTK